MNILRFKVVIIWRNPNVNIEPGCFNLGDLSLISSIAPNFLDPKIGWIKFYCSWGLSIRCHQIVRESPCKILHNRKSSRNMDKLKFPNFKSIYFLNKSKWKVGYQMIRYIDVNLRPPHSGRACLAKKTRISTIVLT